MSFQLNSFDGDQNASHFSQCTTKMQQLEKSSNSRCSPHIRAPFVDSQFFFSNPDSTFFLLHFSTKLLVVTLFLLGKVWKLIRFSFFFLSFFCCNFLHPDTAHCTMRHYKLLYYACSVSTWKTVMHTKFNRFTAKTYTRDRVQMHDIL